MEPLDYRDAILAKLVRFSCLLSEDYVEKYSKQAGKVDGDICSFWKKLIFWCPIFYLIVLPPTFVIYVVISFFQLTFGYIPPKFTHVGESLKAWRNSEYKRTIKRNFGIKRALYPYQVILIFLLVWWWKSSPESMAFISNEVFAPFLIYILPLAVAFFVVALSLIIGIVKAIDSKSWGLFLEGYMSFKGKYCKKLIY